MRKIHLTFIIPLMIILVIDAIFISWFSNKTNGFHQADATYYNKEVVGKVYDSEDGKWRDKYEYYYRGRI